VEKGGQSDGGHDPSFWWSEEGNPEICSLMESSLQVYSHEG
jgi:hypothetical protein